MTTTSSSTHRRALVLGGGGATGNAWSIGVVAGLLDAGLDVTDADLIVGTSAGSTTAAQITAADPAELFATIVAPATKRLAERAQPSGARSVTAHLDRLKTLITSSTSPDDMRHRVGAAALAMDASTDDSRQEWWRHTVASRLPSNAWPDRALLVTAVDARTGEPVLFDRHGDVDLVDAVAASCAGGFAYRIGDRHYIDGGYRTNAENADLATGYQRVLVLSPLGGRSLLPQEWGMRLAVQVDDLRAGGSRVETIVPERKSEHLLGANAMDVSLRAPAAEAGYDCATAISAKVAEFWR